MKHINENLMKKINSKKTVIVEFIFPFTGKLVIFNPDEKKII